MTELLDNLANLVELTEDTILDQLKGRYEVKKIYTYVGDILIAMNPYERLPLYTPEITKMYLNAGANKDNLPPHVYKITDQAYESMVRGRQPQCFVISGESGAGKTETTKHIVSHVMELCKSGRKDLEDRIKTVNPLLEAFGNAKTVMNNNSSRFGKYLELRFDSVGSITGATLSHYLLEKSRVCVRNDNENNFHIFYQLYAGYKSLGKLDAVGLAKPTAHKYLQGVGAPSEADILGERYVTEYHEVVDGLQEVGFPPHMVECMLQSMAAILHLGDTTFVENGSGIRTSNNTWEKAAGLLKINAGDLEKALLGTTTVTRGEVITRNFNLESGPDNRDAMAKGIYGRIFAWIFEVCNSVLAETGAKAALTMGVLDIFGFENFKLNSLEQMCINLTNEQLQQYFNHHIFVAEQAEYAREGVDLSKISFVNNQSTLDLFLKKPAGILAILDEESRFPKATDLTFVEKCAQFKTHESKAFTPARAAKDITFTVTHYAGDVMYTMTNFLEKNRDTLSTDVVSVLQNSLSPLISHIFPVGDAAAIDAAATTKKSGANTLSGLFKGQLSDLMDRMNACQPHFVRCLKPNARQLPSQWDLALATRQLRYAGVLETIRIRKLGYSFRMEFGDFVKQYKLLSYKYHERPPQSKETASAILAKIKLDNFQLGTTKVFMKYYHADLLGNEAKKHTGALLFLQKIVKGYVARERYTPLVKAYRGLRPKVLEFLTSIETLGNAKAAVVTKLLQTDMIEHKKRPWLTRVKEEAEKAAAEKAAKEKAKAEALAKVASEPTKLRTKPSHGYFIWERNDHLTLKVGPLQKPWRKKLDEATGRHYFKNIETKTTSWIDPRTKDFRPMDPLLTKGDELPYGWDEAETEHGTVFYIDHTNNSHHREHPRIELQKKQQAFMVSEAATQAEAEKKRAILTELKQKRQRLMVMKAQATNGDEAAALEARIAELDRGIAKEAENLDSVREASKALLATIMRLRARKVFTDEMRQAAVVSCARTWMKKVLKTGGRRGSKF